MTVQEYITSKFQSFGIKLSEADLFDIGLSIGLESEITADNRNTVFIALVKTVIPQLLLRAKSVSENGFSLTYDTKDLLNYYAWLCGELGIEESLSQKPTIRFK